MKPGKLTEVERRFAEVAHSREEMRELIECPEQLRELRAFMREIAFHEAGHVAARMFTGQEAGHIVYVSILPDADSMGRERSERNIAEVSLVDYPPPMMRGAGRCLLLALLAGRGAAARIATPEEREEILDDAALCMEGEQEGTDLFRALKVAEIMARPGMPARRVLALAAKWTEEALALPDVWGTVERLAGMLRERGTIEDRDEIMTACDGILNAGRKLPKWKRRLLPTKAEQKAMGLPTERLPKWKG